MEVLPSSAKCIRFQRSHSLCPSIAALLQVLRKMRLSGLDLDDVAVHKKVYMSKLRELEAAGDFEGVAEGQVVRKWKQQWGVKPPGAAAAAAAAAAPAGQPGQQPRAPKKRRTGPGLAAAEGGAGSGAAAAVAAAAAAAVEPADVPPKPKRRRTAPLSKGSPQQPKTPGGAAAAAAAAQGSAAAAAAGPAAQRPQEPAALAGGGGMLPAPQAVQEPQPAELRSPALPRAAAAASAAAAAAPGQSPAGPAAPGPAQSRAAELSPPSAQVHSVLQHGSQPCHACMHLFHACAAHWSHSPCSCMQYSTVLVLHWCAGSHRLPAACSNAGRALSPGPALGPGGARLRWVSSIGVDFFKCRRVSGQGRLLCAALGCSALCCCRKAAARECRLLQFACS